MNIFFLLFYDGSIWEPVTSVIHQDPPNSPDLGQRGSSLRGQESSFGETTPLPPAASRCACGLVPPVCGALRELPAALETASVGRQTTGDPAGPANGASVTEPF